jgi:hypothetical protein
MTAVPPLLVLAEGRKPRARRVLAPPPKELSLHIAVATLLRDHLLPGWRATHVASGEHRDIRTAAKLKAMGVRKGWPDFVLIGPAKFGPGEPYVPHFLELKRLGEKLTEEQATFREWAERAEVAYAIAWTLDQALAIFGEWGCLRVAR